MCSVAEFVEGNLFTRFTNKGRLRLSRVSFAFGVDLAPFVDTLFEPLGHIGLVKAHQTFRSLQSALCDIIPIRLDLLQRSTQLTKRCFLMPGLHTLFLFTHNCKITQGIINISRISKCLGKGISSIATVDTMEDHHVCGS